MVETRFGSRLHQFGRFIPKPGRPCGCRNGRPSHDQSAETYRTGTEEGTTRGGVL